MSRTRSFVQMGGLAQFQGNLGYTDRTDRFYDWDSTVANHTRVHRGDLAVIRDAAHVLGLGRIERLEVEHERPKTRRRCPRCATTGFKRRGSLRPTFRCGRCGHEFEHPVEEAITVTGYVAHYSSSWRPMSVEIPVSSIDAAYRARANQHSIRELEPEVLRRVLARRGVDPPESWWHGER